MRLLVIGGSGYVGRMVLPYLAREHQVRVFDLVEPPPGPWEHVLGDVQDMDAVISGSAKADALVYMAMNPQSDPGSLRTVASAFDVNVKGLYLSLWAAAKCGVPHAVYTSTLSVYKDREGRYPDESVPPDATDYYGLTKRFGEQVCEAWVSEGGISVTALRLCYPTDDEAPAPTGAGLRATAFTRASDVAGAMLAALEYRNGFSVFTISGDATEQVTRLTRAKELLHWQPTRPARPAPD